jgi:spore germination protein GerM
MPASTALWILLLIVMITAFFTLVPMIKNKLNFIKKIAETEQEQEPSASTQNPKPEPAPKSEKPEKKQPTPSQPKTPEKKPEAKPQNKAQEKPKPEKPAEPAKPQTQPEKKPQAEKPAAPVQPSVAPSQPVRPQPDAKPVETRNRSIYLIQEINMTPVKINRSLAVSDTPLRDSLAALLAGPTADEKKRGIISLVPEGSRLISARVDGSTAYLNFNEEFQYNTRGREGCAAQIKQIVWTATEFSNIQNVQFLIEGEIVDSLPEGMMINSPISR